MTETEKTEEKLSHDEETMRHALQRMHWAATGHRDTAYMSVPADPRRDADLILARTIDEVLELRDYVAQYETEFTTNALLVRATVAAEKQTAAVVQALELFMKPRQATTGALIHADGSVTVSKEQWARMQAEREALQTAAATDGPVFNSGRSEGHSDIAAKLRAIIDPTDTQHLSLDGALTAVASVLAELGQRRAELAAVPDRLRDERKRCALVARVNDKQLRASYGQPPSSDARARQDGINQGRREAAEAIEELDPSPAAENDE